MNVIITTPIWTGLRSFFLDGKEESKGMPGFYEVFKRLATHHEVDHILLIVFDSPKTKQNIKLPKKYNGKITTIKFSFNGFFSLGLALFKALIDILKYIKIKSNCVCFGHGYTASLVGVVSVLTGIPNIRRIYGISNMIVNKNWPFWKLLIFQPLTYLSISLPGNGVVITNDGSHGDELYLKIKGNTKKLIFQHNGVDRSIVPVKPTVKLPENGSYLSYIGRIYDWKRQLLIVKAIGQLAKEGIRIKCVFVGQIGNEEYVEEMHRIIRMEFIDDLITIIPGLSVNETRYVMSQSLASLSFYETSNLGNVFLEGLSLGVPMIAENVNDSLGGIPNDCYINVLGHTVNEFHTVLKQVIKNPDKLKTVGIKAKKFADENIPTWELRSKLELDLILKTNRVFN